MGKSIPNSPPDCEWKKNKTSRSQIHSVPDAPFGTLEKRTRLVAADLADIGDDADHALAELADIAIVTDTGAEVVTGSTRMKAGTAHKLVLNMLSTCSMVHLGNVYENMMVNLKPSNDKLRERMVGIVADIHKVGRDEARSLLERAGWNIRGTFSNCFQGGFRV